MAANHEGPIIEQSEGPFAAGSWFVLRFDQLRARVTYLVVDPERRVSARVAMSGFGSGNRVWDHDYVLTPLDGGARTQIQVTIDGPSGCVRWAPFTRIMRNASMRRLRTKIEAVG